MPGGDYTGYWCVECDKPGRTPARLVKQLHGKTEGMVFRCVGCNRTFPYAALLAQHPRMDQPTFVEKQPPGSLVVSIWIYPAVLEALRQKFPQNLATTLCDVMTSLADPDTVLIEGENARQFAALGIKRGREVLGLAREVVDLRAKLEEATVREKALAPIFAALGLAAAGQGNAAAAQTIAANSAPAPAPSADPAAAILVNGQRNPSLPPVATFSGMAEQDGILIPTGAAPPAPPPLTAPAAHPSTRPDFVTRHFGG